MEIELNRIRSGRFQPRRSFDAEALLSLAEAILDVGLIYPLVGFINEAGEYELLGGERRWRASCALALVGHLSADLPEVVQRVCQPDWPTAGVGEWAGPLSQKSIWVELRTGSPDEYHLISVMDNFQRQDLSPLEEGQALVQLQAQYGYSLRQLGSKVGKSKSWVDDRVTLAENLDPSLSYLFEANGQPGNSQTEGDVSLDMTVLRHFARKIPQAYQPALAEKLIHALASGESNQTLVKLITDVARLVDASRYKLDSRKPYPPHVRNRARLMAHLLDLLPHQQVIDVACQTERLTTQMAALLEHTWNFYPLANSLLAGQPRPTEISDTAWAQLAPGQGWTCQHCLLRHLTQMVAARSEAIDYTMPCKRLKTTRLNPDNRDAPPPNTCDSFIDAENNPPVLVIPKIVWTYLEFSHYREVIHGQEVADQEYFTNNLADYIDVYNQAVEAQQQVQATQITAYLEKMRHYWQVQQLGVLNLDHFYACACGKCRHFSGGAEVPCRFAVEPLTTDDEPRAPAFGVWLPESGRPLPRCEMFEYPLGRLAVQQPLLSGTHISDRAMVAGWFDHVLAVDVWRLNHTHLYGILGWLGVRSVDDLLAAWQAINNDDVMLAVLHTAISEMEVITTFHPGDSSFSVLSPYGERHTFAFGDFETYFERKG